MSNASQLFLLADHIRLSLLERQRAVSLDLEPNSHDGEIARSLESLRSGIETLERNGTTTDQIPLLKAQIQELHAQFFPDAAGPFKDNPDSSSPASSASPPPLEQPVPQRPVSKSVRFTDDTADPSLGPYHDEPPAEPEYDHSDLDNVGIHQDHARIMCDQDTQLDRLGESIGRQHQLSIQIGDELESQVDLLDDVDDHTDRSQSRLNRASRRLGRLRTSASKERSGMMTIVGLIIILVVLIVILK